MVIIITATNVKAIFFIICFLSFFIFIFVYYFLFVILLLS